MGKRIEDSRGEVALSADFIEYYAINAERFLTTQKLAPSSADAKIEKEPLGVLFGVQPWNFPYYQLARYAAPNLMAGNVVMVKHAGSPRQRDTNPSIQFKGPWMSRKYGVDVDGASFFAALSLSVRRDRQRKIGAHAKTPWRNSWEYAIVVMHSTSKMKINLKDYRVSGGKKVRLKEWATDIKPLYKTAAHYKEILAEDVEKLSNLQRLLYASNKASVLLVFQAMDAAGKDGAISHILTGINPQGCEVYSFKHPSTEELQHDFLWRTTRCLPARGRIGVFNRSYYEEVLIVRVHPEILKNEHIADEPAGKKRIWERRYRSIVDFERHLHRNGVVVLKFFLHLSKEEQRKRFLERIDEPDKNWKFSVADIEERKYWDHYMEAYEDCLNATSTKAAPWYVIPADDKLNARLIISRVVIDALAELKMRYPKVNSTRRCELREIRGKLLK